MGQIARSAKDVGEVILVLITDGKAKVSLGRSLASSGVDGPESMGLEGIRLEVLGLGDAIRRLAMELLVIDTGPLHGASGLGQELARHAGGRFVPLPRASQRQISATARGVLGRGSPLR
jgi:magnesium chelatase subunit D